jgi:hypothetical protein
MADGHRFPHDLSNMAALAGYHTPNVPNGGRQPRGGMTPTGMTPDGKKRQVGLEQDARLCGWPTTMLAGWPTSTQRDLKNVGLPESAAARKEAGHAQPLNEIAQMAGWPTTTTTRDSKHEGKDGPNRTGSPSLPGLITALFLVPMGRRVVLAPEFSLWLMGFPEAWAKAAPNSDAWCAAQAALELECSKEAATPSSPSSPQPSSVPILEQDDKKEKSNHMNELLQAATRAFNAIADHYERQNQPALPLRTATAEPASAEAPKKERKARTPKAEAPTPTPETAPQQGSPLDDVLGKPSQPTERQYTDEDIKARAEKLAETFVMRFKNAAPTGVERAKTILAALGVQRMAQLDRNGNFKFIAELEAQLKGETVGAGR